jgi:hypothetical protein
MTQIRTERIGLGFFLYKVGVPGYETGECQCGEGAETLRHLFLECREEETRREELMGGRWRRRSWLQLTSDPKLARLVSRWYIQTKRLPQFELAARLLYNAE